MEGVVLVEKLSGSLVFTRSFTKSFDLRHPRSERMNLSALLFALLSFADNSMDSLKDGPGTPEKTTNVPSISMFATPLERIVLAQTPSKKLFVALFTAPTLDADVAKSLVRRLAYNYEHGDSLENRIAVVLNQGPRLFRDALSRSIEEQVDELLESFAAQQLGGGAGSNSNSSSGSNNNTSTHRKSVTSETTSSPPAFILFYFSDHLLYKKCREFNDNSSDRPENNERIASRHVSAVPSNPLGALGFRSPLALGSGAVANKPAQASASSPTPAPSRPELSRAQSNLPMRSVYASTRSLFPNPLTRDIAGAGGNRKIKKKKAKKNAVMDHAEPQIFQRVVRLSSSHSGSGGQASLYSGDPVSSSTDAITYVVVPFLKQVIPLFFTGATKLRRQSNQQQQTQHQPDRRPAAARSELKHMSWKNFALEPSPQQQTQSQESAKANTTDLVAWKQGNCLIIYPENSSATGGGEPEKSAMTESVRLRRERERKSAVITLFDALEPLVQALMIGRT